MRFFAASLLAAAACLFASPALAFRNFEVSSDNMMPLLGAEDVVTAALYGVDYEALAKGQPLVPSDDPRFQPRRGDVAFFTVPDGTIFVMRIVGLGGDRVQMIEGVLFLNGEMVPTEPVGQVEGACPEGETCSFFREALPGEAGSHVVMSQSEDGPADDTEVFVVPAGSFFVMGDNRDNSNDSRFGTTEFGIVGFVRRAAMIGRLHAILFSPRATPAAAERLAGFPNLR